MRTDVLSVSKALIASIFSNRCNSETEKETFDNRIKSVDLKEIYQFDRVVTLSVSELQQTPNITA